MSKTASVLMDQIRFCLFILVLSFNLACVCPLFLFHRTLFSFIINLSPCKTGNIILSPYQAST